MLTITDLLYRAARQFAPRTAARDNRRDVTYQELDRRTNRLAHALLAHQSEAEGRVAILMQNRVEFIEGDVACIKAGKTKVPINTRLTEHERRHILSDSGAYFLLVDENNADFALTALDEIDTLFNVAVVGGDGGNSYEELLSAGRDVAVSSRASATVASQLLYTSGTTGKPKGAELSFQARFASALTMLRDELTIDPNDIMGHVAPLSHGSGSKVLPFLLRGAENRLFENFDPGEFLAAVSRGEVTASFMVPTMIQRLVEAHDGHAVLGLNQISYGGAPMAIDRLREALDTLGPVLAQVYGSCEAPHPVTVLSKAAHVENYHDDDVLRSAGVETLTSTVKITDRDGSEVEPGVVGEVLVHTPSLMTGYWRNPEATAGVMDGVFYKTGDVGFRDERGYVTFVDRERDVIISGGLNIYPAEVEAVLREHAAVADVAVIGVPDDEWGESVRAYVVLQPGVAVEPASLLGLCQQRLASYKKPKSFKFLDELPKGSTGKVIKKALREAAWDGKARNIN